MELFTLFNPRSLMSVLKGQFIWQMMISARRVDCRCVLIGGVWGSICGESWDKTDAFFVCQQLKLGKGGQSYIYTILDQFLAHVIHFYSFTILMSIYTPVHTYRVNQLL